MAGLIEVIEGGLACSVQDQGRPGYRSLGVALSGALDPLWLACANALAGNAPEAAALELRGLGPTLRAASPVRLALAGPVEGRIRRAEGAEEPLHAWRGVQLGAGDLLQLGPVRGGVAYLALAGGVDVPPRLGSRSTYARAGIGGIAGRGLRPGDRLPLGPSDDAPLLQADELRHESGPIRLLPGPQDEYFTAQAHRTLLAGQYIVTRDTDRMGMRLDGPPLDRDPGRGPAFVSDGVAPGAVQVPPDGRPIVLLADCQTVGGYPKIACVIRADLPRLAHLLPGARLRFVEVGRAQALAALREQAAAAARWLAALRPLRPSGAVDEAALYTSNLISGAVDVFSFLDRPSTGEEP